MATVKEIYTFIDSIAPFVLQMSFDNAGFLVGDGSTQIDRVLCALDITEAVIDEAVEKGAALIVTHHPLIMNPLKAVTNENRTGALLLRLIQNGIAVISAHTNLDSAQGGMNDVLAELLGVENTTIFIDETVDPQGRPFGLGRIGQRRDDVPSGFSDFAAFVKEELKVDALRCYDAGKPVERIAILGGGGANWTVDAARCGCDTYVTADVKHDQYLEAISCGINLIDAGHFKTEDVVIPVLVQQLSEAFPAVSVFRSESSNQPYSSY